MRWRKAVTGWVSQDGVWRIRGPIMGKSMFWLYRVGVGRVTADGRYENALHFSSVAAAKRYAERLVA